MEQSSFQDEQTVRHQFYSLCKLALKSEVIIYEKHMAYPKRMSAFVGVWEEIFKKFLNKYEKIVFPVF